MSPSPPRLWQFVLILLISLTDSYGIFISRLLTQENTLTSFELLGATYDKLNSKKNPPSRPSSVKKIKSTGGHVVTLQDCKSCFVIQSLDTAFQQIIIVSPYIFSKQTTLR